MHFGSVGSLRWCAPTLLIGQSVHLLQLYVIPNVLSAPRGEVGRAQEQPPSRTCSPGGYKDLYEQQNNAKSPEAERAKMGGGPMWL